MGILTKLFVRSGPDINIWISNLPTKYGKWQLLQWWHFFPYIICDVLLSRSSHLTHYRGTGNLPCSLLLFWSCYILAFVLLHFSAVTTYTFHYIQKPPQRDYYWQKLRKWTWFESCLVDNRKLNSILWKLYTTYLSYMGGWLERLLGIVRRNLDNIPFMRDMIESCMRI